MSGGWFFFHFFFQNGEPKGCLPWSRPRQSPFVTHPHPHTPTHTQPTHTHTRSERREADAEREGARRAKFGDPSGPRSAWESSGARAGARGGGGPRRRPDFLGYYRLMGLDPQSGADGDAVKAAFKKAALRLHPDRHEGGGDPRAVAAAGERFRRLRAAYEVLKDPERRKEYDRGRLADPPG